MASSEETKQDDTDTSRGIEVGETGNFVTSIESEEIEQGVTIHEELEEDDERNLNSFEEGPSFTVPVDNAEEEEPELNPLEESTVDENQDKTNEQEVIVASDATTEGEDCEEGSRVLERDGDGSNRNTENCSKNDGSEAGVEEKGNSVNAADEEESEFLLSDEMQHESLFVEGENNDEQGNDNDVPRTSKVLEPPTLLDKDEDDDLVILEERPAPSKKTPSTPSISQSVGQDPDPEVDLEMECIEEPLEESQLISQQTEESAFQETMKLMEKWSLKKRMEANRSSTTVLGAMANAAARVLNSAPLTRPPQPLKPGQTVPSSIRSGSVMNPPRLNLGKNSKHLRAPDPRGKILVRPILQTGSAPQQVAYRQSRSTCPMQPAANAPTAARNFPAPSSQAAMSQNQITLPNGQVVNMQQFQPLLFDSQSGLLLMPTSGSGKNASTTAVSSVQNQGSIDRSTAAISVGGTAIPAPPVIKTSTQASLAQTLTSFTPRIVGTSSLYKPRPASVAAAASARASGLPSLKPVSSFVRTKAACINSGYQRPRAPPPRLGVPPVTRPSQENAAVETTNTFNGTPADKDTNNNKTYPSLVVLVKPCLGEKVSRLVLNSARAELDSRVKALLLHSPAKLTEWLMQQGLLRLEHRCPLHMTPDRENIKYKLGMYSEGSKQPFSGGYVWITECCPEKQISVFHGSIFESAVYTPGTIMKLIYHWACQTTAQNVLQWVKVSSYYLKNFYTLLRSSCVAALHEFAPIMGGYSKVVEVGIITLGTAVAQTPANQKPIKIEILGVFDPSAKTVRMKVINPLSFSTSTSAQTRIQQILWPLKHWVDKDSTVLIDTSIERSCLLEMGFKKVIQSKPGAAGVSLSNSNVMNYLKHVVPKMFQSTLCVLSKSLIQQFLDELSWREIWGSTSVDTFDNIINHLVQMTKWEMGETLISRLNKISLNPFAEWSYTKSLPVPATGIDLLPESIRCSGPDMPTLESYAAYSEKHNGYSNVPSPTALGGQNRRRKESNSVSNPPVLLSEESFPTKATKTTFFLKRKNENLRKDDLRQYLLDSRDAGNWINLYSYYYAESKATIERDAVALFPSTLRCPLCDKGFLTNQEIVRHIASHVNSIGRPKAQAVFCEFCLKEIQNSLAYALHLAEVHRQEDSLYPCHICLEDFSNKDCLIIHMWETHGKAEMPYKCDFCNYRNSKHHELVEHFGKEHGGTDQVLCPICLKVHSARSLTDMKGVVAHLQSHAEKKGKKCPQCVLTFISDLDYRQHIAVGCHDEPVKDGNCSPLRSLQDKCLRMPTPPIGSRSKFILPPPPKKMKTNNLNQTVKVAKPKDPHLAQLDKDGVLKIENIKFFMAPGEETDEVYVCCECKNDVRTPNHFSGCFTCSKCKFSSSCEMSMLIHNRNTHPLGQTPKAISSISTEPPTYPHVSCRCGFTADSMKTFMSHIVRCQMRTGFVANSTDGNHDDVEGKKENKLPSPESPEAGILLGLGLHRTRDSRV